jgi:hypothetical protein
LEYANITDAPFWGNLDFDSEIDEEMLLKKLGSRITNFLYLGNDDKLIRNKFWSKI